VKTIIVLQKIFSNLITIIISKIIQNLIFVLVIVFVKFFNPLRILIISLVKNKI